MRQDLFEHTQQVFVVFHHKHGGRLVADFGGSGLLRFVVCEHERGGVVDFLGLVCLHVDGQCHCERAALASLAFYADRSVVQRDEILDQREADARAVSVEPSVLALIEAGEERRQLVLVDALAAIADTDDGQLAFPTGIHADPSAGMVVFGGVADEVVDDLVKGVGVEISSHLRLGHGEREVDALAVGQWPDALNLFVHKCRQASLFHAQMQIAGL